MTFHHSGELEVFKHFGTFAARAREFSSPARRASEKSLKK
jgi:hypothetical protein